MNKPHKHATLIKKWADGAKIEFRDVEDDIEWRPIIDSPCWFNTTEYRVKPDLPMEELWVNHYPHSMHRYVHASREKALERATNNCLGTYRYVLAGDQE